MDDKSLSKVVSHNVRHWRHERGLTQQELAHAASMDRSYLARLEANACNISLRKLESLSKALDVEPAELVSE